MKLKSCPVCGQKPKIAKVEKPHTLCSDTIYTYYCGNCHAINIGMWNTFQKAGKVWNNRVSQYEGCK